MFGLRIIFQENFDIFQYFQVNQLGIILTSYNVVEILRVLKRISKKTKVSYKTLENSAWNMWNFSCIHQMFDKPLSETLIRDIKNLPEYQIIAKAFELEPKNVPYIVASFQYHACLVTTDLRSLISQSQILHERLDINVITWSALLEWISQN